MFLSTYEKQLDAKRRFVVPQDFRSAATGAEQGVFCFPSIEADCIEAGGQALFDQYQRVIDSLPFGDPLRSSLEWMVFGEQRRLAYDTAGRITLPEGLCQEFGLDDEVVIVGLRDRFQIWSRKAWQTRRDEQRRAAREGLSQFAALRRTHGGNGQGGGQG
ncbi:division/cell wall cluster transcriptional repressor MraZ [Brevundimonas sp. 2R-24]|uniref:Transcriptional regulator MraZ n=1 Tax=Peiella sedimenti TaxID=3061083 RepID=A0ABT8SMF7_9CAUL|nr:division/cell wall cluster transcriptional repressor MraZ [Caulobacteraceae bacterium XZ-24]